MNVVTTVYCLTLTMVVFGLGVNVWCTYRLSHNNAMVADEGRYCCFWLISCRIMLCSVVNVSGWTLYLVLTFYTKNPTQSFKINNSQHSTSVHQQTHTFYHAPHLCKVKIIYGISIFYIDNKSLEKQHNSVKIDEVTIACQ